MSDEKHLFEALNRGFTPRRAAYPTLAGRQGNLCTRAVKDYSTQASAFLLDSPGTH